MFTISMLRNKKIKLAGLAIAGALLTAPIGTGAGSAAASVQQIYFAPGTSGAVLDGGLVLGEIGYYYMEAYAGQRLTANISSLEGNARFAVYAPNGLMLHPGPLTSPLYLPYTGNYLVKVTSTRGNASYRLTVAIS